MPRRKRRRRWSFAQFLVDQTPRFDELIMEDIRPTDGWLLAVEDEIDTWLRRAAFELDDLEKQLANLAKSINA